MCSFKIYGIWPQANKYVCTYTYTSIQCGLASVDLTQACPKQSYVPTPCLVVCFLFVWLVGFCLFFFVWLVGFCLFVLFVCLFVWLVFICLFLFGWFLFVCLFVCLFKTLVKVSKNVFLHD